MAIKVYYSNYQLEFNEGSTHEGCLIKIENEFGSVGYADLHPLLKFKDAPKEKQIELFQMKKPTQLFQNTLTFAKKDLELREKKENLFSKSSMQIQNHYLITNIQLWKVEQLKQIYNHGFKTIKCKWLPQYTRAHFKNLVNIGFKIRLDFNAQWSYAQVIDFISQLSESELKQIEFIEDPCPYDEMSWSSINKKIPLALDFEGASVNWEGELPFKNLILKPARDVISDVVQKAKQHQLNLVVTSSMDHPVGLLQAAGVLLKVKEQVATCSDVHGLSTFLNLKPNAFTEAIQMKNAVLLGAEGIGVGFDSLLQDCRWVRII